MKKTIIFTIGVVLVGVIIATLVLFPKYQKAKYETQFSKITQKIFSSTDVFAGIVFLVSVNIEENATQEAERSKSHLDRLSYGLQNMGKLMQYVQEKVRRDEKIEEWLKLSAENEKFILIGMKQLKKYPKDYKEAYVLLLELYSTYTQIYMLAKNPPSSVFSLNNKFDNLTASFFKTLSKLRVYIPSIPETANLKPEIKD